jgi:hypothetical protein
MTVEIEAKNLCIIILEDWKYHEKNKNALALDIDAVYQHKWIGDSWYGPGTVTIDIAADLKRAYILPCSYLVRPIFVEKDYDEEEIQYNENKDVLKTFIGKKKSD